MDLVGTILPLALVVGLSPLPILPMVLVLMTPRARPNSLAFLGAWFVALTAIVLGALLLAGVRDPAPPDEKGIGWIQVVTGVAFLALALVKWLRRPRPGDAKEPPTWMSALDSYTPRQSAALGAGLAAGNPKNLVMAIAAGAEIAALTTSAGNALVGRCRLRPRGLDRCGDARHRPSPARRPRARGPRGLEVVAGGEQHGPGRGRARRPGRDAAGSGALGSDLTGTERAGASPSPAQVQSGSAWAGATTGGATGWAPPPEDGAAPAVGRLPRRAGRRSRAWRSTPGRPVRAARPTPDQSARDRRTARPASHAGGPGRAGRARSGTSPRRPRARPRPPGPCAPRPP